MLRHLLSLSLLLTLSGLPMTHANESLNIMTFNIRYDNPNDPYIWSERKEEVASVINELYHAHSAGLQEVLHHQLTELQTLLPDYAYVGVGRNDGKQEGEYTPIFYRQDRLELLDHDTFWLSETPQEAGSQSWDSSLPRIVTWAKFKDSANGQIFYHFNTHFDHRGQQARLESAKLILRKVKEIADDMPVVLTGDFNIRETSEPYKHLAGDTELPDDLEPMTDARYFSMNAHQGPTSTFTDWKEHGPPNSRIDYIFVKNGFGVKNHITVNDKFDGFYPSDHLPVLAEITWPEESN